MARPVVSIVVAADERNAIGLGGGLPWHLPEDLRRFKALTLGKPVVMGRRTWESIGRPLPGRHNIVMTCRPDFAPAGATVVASFDEALESAAGAPEVCVIGGAELFRLALPVADALHLTRVHAVVEADTFFPEIDTSRWREVAREDRPADERHAHGFSFIELRRAS